jgi:glycosyltransferase involved in cell wall biosynthesis
MRSFIAKYYQKIKGIAEAYRYNRQNKSASYDLLILDDFFPNPLSSFRFTEFNHYFRQFDNTIVLTTGGALPLINEKKSIRQFIQSYKQQFPKQAVSTFNFYKKPFAKACYCVFLNNAYNFLPYFEKHQLPFVFCLYPGGGFNLNIPETDKKLHDVCQSPYFKGVIVTQKVTYDYLLDKGFCTKNQIRHIFGGIIAIGHYPILENRPYFGFAKKTLDICFMANKYMTGGKDKGFDVFAGVAKHFAGNSTIQFHVIGGFAKTDITDYDARNILFHGMKLTEELNLFFEKMDIILSPNRPFVLNNGAFDGFPTGSCVEAALKGVAMFVTDPLSMNSVHQMNNVYENGENIEIIQPDVADVVSKIQYYLVNPERLRRLALNCQTRTRFLFSDDIQLTERVDFLKEKLDEKGPLISYQH